MASLLPALLPIFLCDVLLVHIYANAFDPHHFYLKLFGYILAQAAATGLIGFFADRWGRKKVLLIIHVIALLILTISYFFSEVLPYGLILSSVIFSPAPACRAELVHNYHSGIASKNNHNFYNKLGLTEVRLIALSWLAQYLPWAFYPIIVRLENISLLIMFNTSVVISLALISCLIRNKIDAKNQNRNNLAAIFINYPYAFLALLFAQMVFFSFFDKIQALDDSQFLFCLVGIGAFLGTGYSLAYRKTPHVAAITNSYMIGLMLSFTSFLYLFSNNPIVPIGLQIIQISAIGGSYLPYVYDMISARGGPGRRSIMFATAEITQLMASILGIGISAAVGKANYVLFGVASFLFLLAIISQSKEEIRS